MKSWETYSASFDEGLTQWGRVTHICVGKLTIMGSDNGLSPRRCQAIIWTNAGILLILTLGTNFSEISSAIHTSSFKKMHLKISSAKWRPFCLGLNVLKQRGERLSYEPFLTYKEFLMLSKCFTVWRWRHENGNILRVTGPLWGESTGHRWIPLTKAINAELWCILWCAPEQTAEQTIEMPVIWDAMVPIMTSL